jgi:hypothetical protein
VLDISEAAQPIRISLSICRPSRSFLHALNPLAGAPKWRDLGDRYYYLDIVSTYSFQVKSKCGGLLRRAVGDVPSVKGPVHRAPCWRKS